ncbi:hypothetical protein CEXT_700531 [Caerostris extrusa]|uniref:Uncharacterized protein n=1 Tax=Caerostris extrusa TaxID=172846 RepID=A0AAV4RY41_CAEEX|nr:hypothetical protein CEXT_700531 [Caerostris extrusa]
MSPELFSWCLLHTVEEENDYNGIGNKALSYGVASVRSGTLQGLRCPFLSEGLSLGVRLGGQCNVARRLSHSARGGHKRPARASTDNRLTPPKGATVAVTLGNSVQQHRGE